MSSITIPKDIAEKGILFFLGDKYAKLYMETFIRFSKDKKYLKERFPFYIELTPKEYKICKKLYNEGKSPFRGIVVAFYKKRIVILFYAPEETWIYFFNFIKALHHFVRKKNSNKTKLEVYASVMKKILYELYFSPGVNPYFNRKSVLKLNKNQKKALWLFFFKTQTICIPISIIIACAFAYYMEGVRYFSVSYMVGLGSFLSGVFLAVSIFCIIIVIIQKRYMYQLDNIRYDVLISIGCSQVLKDDIGCCELVKHIKSRKDFGIHLSNQEGELLTRFFKEQNPFKQPQNFLQRENENSKDGIFLKIADKSKAKLIKETLVYGLYEHGFANGQMTIDGRLSSYDANNYAISTDYTLNPEGEMLVAMINRLYES